MNGLSSNAANTRRDRSVAVGLAVPIAARRRLPRPARALPWTRPQLPRRDRRDSENSWLGQGVSEVGAARRNHQRRDSSAVPYHDGTTEAGGTASPAAWRVTCGRLRNGIVIWRGGRNLRQRAIEGRLEGDGVRAVQRTSRATVVQTRGQGETQRQGPGAQGRTSFNEGAGQAL